jgi:hypothetical protein
MRAERAGHVAESTSAPAAVFAAAAMLLSVEVPVPTAPALRSKVRLPCQFSVRVYVRTLAFFNGLSTLMPSVALLLSESAVGKQVP